MKKFFTDFLSDRHTGLEWLCIKFSLAYFWLNTIGISLRRFDTVPIPSGICKLIPCELFTHHFAQTTMYWTAILFVILYVLEKKMMLTTFILFSISLIVFTIEESNGIHERRGLLTFVFFAQFLAYFINYHNKDSFDLPKFRIQFGIQVIAIGYFLSAVSKLRTSGFNWITDGEKMTLQIMKSFHGLYTTRADPSFINKGVEMASFIESNPALVHVTLTLTMMLELGAIFTLFMKKKFIVLYGILLLAMHIGIDYVMNIQIVAIMKPMLILFINPLFLIALFLISIWNYIKKQSNLNSLKD